MTPLDLSVAPPRNGHDRLAGIVFLPRTIDKLRASLPGGNLGLYELPGFTEAQCEAFGIAVSALTEAVARASNDDDIAAYVLGATTPERIEAWNAMILARKVQGGNRENAIKNYPYLADRPDVPLALDNLIEDDRRLFPEYAR